MHSEETSVISCKNSPGCQARERGRSAPSGRRGCRICRHDINEGGKLEQPAMPLKTSGFMSK